jgi:phospholipid/cholesterol/gamma-HCH transport system substrate-binding protein
MELHVRYILVGVFVLITGLMGLSFVLWIQNKGSLQDRLELTVRFETTANGLRVGAPVTFNGVRVGEVSRITFDRGDLDAVDAHLVLEAQTPITGTTQAALETQGWLGTAYIALTGGDRNAPIERYKKQVPVLLAQTTKPLSQEGRETLRAIRDLVDHNSEGIQQSVANIRSFTDVLSRNGERVEAIIKGLEKTLGGDASDAKPTTYDLGVPQASVHFKNAITLGVADPTAAAGYDSQRVMSVSVGGELVPLPIQLVDTVPRLLQRRLVQALEGTGLAQVTTLQDNPTPDVQLALDLRSFQIDEGTPARAKIVLGLRLTGTENKPLGQRVFEGLSDVSGEGAASSIEALNTAFAAVVRQMLPWLVQQVAEIDQSETKTGATGAPAGKLDTAGSEPGHQ